MFIIVARHLPRTARKLTPMLMLFSLAPGYAPTTTSRTGDLRMSGSYSSSYWRSADFAFLGPTVAPDSAFIEEYVDRFSEEEPIQTVPHGMEPAWHSHMPPLTLLKGASATPDCELLLPFAAPLPPFAIHL